MNMKHVKKYYIKHILMLDIKQMFLILLLKKKFEEPYKYVSLFTPYKEVDYETFISLMYISLL